MTLNDYLKARKKTIRESIAAEALSGNVLKEHGEQMALAEILALELAIARGEIKQEIQDGMPFNKVDQLLKMQIEECRYYAQRCARDWGAASADYDKWIKETPLVKYHNKSTKQEERR